MLIAISYCYSYKYNKNTNSIGRTRHHWKNMYKIINLWNFTILFLM